MTAPLTRRQAPRSGGQSRSDGQSPSDAQSLSDAQGQPSGGPAGQPTSRPVSASGATVWRRWRVPLALAAVILLGGTVVALLQPGPASTAYLDPQSITSAGAHAITDILADRGYSVSRQITPAGAQAAARAAGPADTTLVVTSPGLLTGPQLASLARSADDLVVIGPDRAALSVLAPGSSLHGVGPVQPLQPGCGLQAARLAGNADLGGALLSVAPAPGQQATLCYPERGYATLVQYAAGGRLITLLGSGNALTNGSLARLGNAALALDLLSSRRHLVWLVPPPGPRPGIAGLPGGGGGGGGGSAGGHESILHLFPWPAELVAMQLGVALVLAALWRVRRLGPLVPEPLPVVVRASETVEGQAGLYRSRRARDRAAAALRTAMLARTLPALGLAPDAAPPEVLAAVGARSASPPARIEAILFGPPPADDAGLVALADDLDALDREVSTT